MAQGSLRITGGSEFLEDPEAQGFWRLTGGSEFLESNWRLHGGTNNKLQCRPRGSIPLSLKDEVADVFHQFLVGLPEGGIDLRLVLVVTD